MTDVTGFGLLGHALEMARGAGATLAIDDAEGPAPRRRRRRWPAGLRDRRLGAQLGELRRRRSRCRPACPSWRRMLLTDPQTSGGLAGRLRPTRPRGLGAAIRAADIGAGELTARLEAIGAQRIASRLSARRAGYCLVARR